jgi:hypothetical protein
MFFQIDFFQQLNSKLLGEVGTATLLIFQEW